MTESRHPWRPRALLALMEVGAAVGAPRPATALLLTAAPASAGAQEEPWVVRVGLHAFEGNFNPFTPPTALPYTQTSSTWCNGWSPSRW